MKTQELKEKKYIENIWTGKPTLFNPTITPVISKDTYDGAIQFKNMRSLPDI